MMKGFENKTEPKKIEFATAFDTMWSIMLALKEANAENFPLEDNVKKFLGNAVITKTIVSKLENLSFEGLTVIVLYSNPIIAKKWQINFWH